MRIRGARRVAATVASSVAALVLLTGLAAPAAPAPAGDEPPRILAPRNPRAVTAAGGATRSYVPSPTPGRDYGSGSGALGPWWSGARMSTSAAVRASADVWEYADSIGYADAADLVARLAARTGARVAVDAWNSRPTHAAVARLRTDLATTPAPPVVLMAVGSNDIFAPTAMASHVDRVMAAVPPTTQVVWVDVYVARTKVAPTVRAADLRNSALINAQLAVAEQMWPNLTVVRWHACVSASPLGPATHLLDGVHTTPTGRAARNELIVAALAPALRR